MTGNPTSLCPELSFMTEFFSLIWVIIYGWKTFFSVTWFMLCYWESSVSPSFSSVFYPSWLRFSLLYHFTLHYDMKPLSLSPESSRNTGKLLYDLISSVQFSSVQSLSCIRLFATPWTSARQASLSITNSWSSLKLMSIELVMPSNHLILNHPLKIPFMRGILFLYLIIYDGNTFLWPWLLLVTGYSLFVSISFR